MFLVMPRRKKVKEEPLSDSELCANDGATLDIKVEVKSEHGTEKESEEVSWFRDKIVVYTCTTIQWNDGTTHKDRSIISSNTHYLVRYFSFCLLYL